MSSKQKDLLPVVKSNLYEKKPLSIAYVIVRTTEDLGFPLLAEFSRSLKNEHIV